MLATRLAGTETRLAKHQTCNLPGVGAGLGVVRAYAICSSWISQFMDLWLSCYYAVM